MVTRLGWTVLARWSRFGDDDHHHNDHDDDDDDDDSDNDFDDNNDVGLGKVEWIVIGSSFHTLSLPNVLARYPEVTNIV